MTYFQIAKNENQKKMKKTNKLRSAPKLIAVEKIRNGKEKRKKKENSRDVFLKLIKKDK